jgi:nicotinamide mononucleotide (NMN) deamidase PncC
MASLARERLNAGIGISIEGQMEKSDDVPMAKVFIAIAGPKSGQTLVRSYSGRLNQMVNRTAYQALFELKKVLA